MFKLVIEDDEGNKTVVPIIRDEITIGRQDGNTIRLTERNVSRKHARLLRDNGAVFLEEIEARYGTRKNGERIDGRTEFGVGDVFTIGDYRLTLQSEVANEPKKPEPPPKPNGATKPPAGNEFSNQPTQITDVSDADSAPKEGTAILPKDPAKLVIVSSNFAGQEFPLARSEMVIGRGEECDIIIDHRSVSQKHAKVVREQGGEYKIVDLKSKNGVKVGGEEYRAVHLKRGDIIELGHVKFRFVEPGENYVFSPQSDVETSFERKSSKGPILLAGLVVLAVGGAIVWFAGQDASADSDEVVVPPTPKTIAEKTTPPDDDKEDEPKADEESDEEAQETQAKVDELIEQAETAYAEGHIRDTIARLDAARVLDITPEQDDRIAELRSKAVREKGPAEALRTGRRDLKRERWTDALAAFNQIPPEPEMRVYELMEAEGLKQKAIDGALEEAATLSEEEDYEEALELLDELSTYATDAEEEIASAEEAVIKARRRARRQEQQKRQQAAATTDTKSDTSDTPPEPEPDMGKAQALKSKGTDAMMAGNWDESIRLCKQALQHGPVRQCYRVIATSYNKKGDKANACKWATKANSSDMLERFECE